MPKKIIKKMPKKSSKRKITKKTSGSKPKAVPKIKFFGAVGRRKRAVARVRLSVQKEKIFLVNEKTLEAYFPILELQAKIFSPLKETECLNKFKVSVITKGGGLQGQAEAIRHGISRALILFNPDFRKTLKKAGFLTRDSRMRERKKFGLKRARRAPQWSKR